MQNVEARPDVRIIQQGEPRIRLLVANGSERGDFMPLETLIPLIGGVYTGINLMAEWYPERARHTANFGLPYRTLFGQDVPHYRNWYKDQTAKTQLRCPAQGTDGYYPFNPNDPRNDVVLQMENVRRFGHDVRLTLTLPIDTHEDVLEKLAGMQKDFGPVEDRVNHEANANTWFVFAQSVGSLPPGPARDRIYQNISKFFIRANEIMTKAARNVRLVACYNGPAEEVNAGRLASGVYPFLTREELGQMYYQEDIGISMDQYLSLHYGWPGHRILNPPVIGRVTHADHQSFALRPDVLFEKVILPFQEYISQQRSEHVRLDLGEMGVDRDIHGEDIASYLVQECFERIAKAPDAIGSVVFYDAADMGGLGLFQQKPYEYGNLTDTTETGVTREFRKIMKWPEFQHSTQEVPNEQISADVQEVELVWRSSTEARGMEIPVDPSVNAVDLKKPYWHRVVLFDGNGEKKYQHTDAQVLEVPQGTTKVQVFALPPDGRNNQHEGQIDGFYKTVPMPQLQRSAVIFESAEK